MGFDNPIHILILLLVVLLVFGAKRLPEIGRSLGDGMRGFKDSLSGAHSQAATLEAPAAPVGAPLAGQSPAHADAARLADAGR